MKRIIYRPAQFEQIPPGAVAYYLPLNHEAIDAIVPDDFTIAGTVFYDSLNGPMLNEPPIHHFAGWEF